MAKEKKEKKAKKAKKEGRSFIKDFKAELKKVIWPTSQQMVSNVIAVITIVLITAAIVFVLDFGFGALNEFGINKLKVMVESKQQTQSIENSTTNATTPENEGTTTENSVENNTVDNTENTENQ